MCRPPSSSKTVGVSNDVASRSILKLGAPPPSPRDLSHSCQNDRARRQIARPPLIPAAESALGLRPRSALSSAQVFPEWITSTSPCNDLSANGDYPLNFVSHSRGSVQVKPRLLDYLEGQMQKHAAVAVVLSCLAPPPFPFGASIAAASALRVSLTVLVSRTEASARSGFDGRC
jgi:hypothetical protein